MNGDGKVKVKILGQFDYQTYPITDDMVEIPDADIQAVRVRTKCFNDERNGVIDYTPPKSTPEEQEAEYKDMVVRKIRLKYTTEDELAILRQQTEKPEEYQAYYDYCEQCKAASRIFIFGGV